MPGKRQAEGDVVLGEDVCQSLEFAGVRGSEHDLLAFRRELFYFFKHGRNGAVEPGRWLGEEADGRLGFGAARYAEVLNIGSGKHGHFSLPVFRRQIEIFRRD